jgi:hypothetical protein
MKCNGATQVRHAVMLTMCIAHALYAIGVFSNTVVAQGVTFQGDVDPPWAQELADIPNMQSQQVHAMYTHPVSTHFALSVDILATVCSIIKGKYKYRSRDPQAITPRTLPDGCQAVVPQSM